MIGKILPQLKIDWQKPQNDNALPALRSIKSSPAQWLSNKPAPQPRWPSLDHLSPQSAETNTSPSTASVSLSSSHDPWIWPKPADTLFRQQQIQLMRSGHGYMFPRFRSRLLQASSARSD